MLQVTVDEFLFGGFNTGTLRLLKRELIDKNLASGKMVPYVIQKGKNDDLYFAALNTKSNTTHNE